MTEAEWLNKQLWRRTEKLAWYRRKLKAALKELDQIRTKHREMRDSFMGLKRKAEASERRRTIGDFERWDAIERANRLEDALKPLMEIV
jgi:predicted  nucleic acid-binding Zn-ribbon protein